MKVECYVLRLRTRPCHTYGLSGLHKNRGIRGKTVDEIVVSDADAL